jgi:RNA polymerase sigma-70 factor (ECF subfamily)
VPAVEPPGPTGVLKVIVVEHKRDEELLADHLAGSTAAFEALVGRYTEDLYGFFQRFVGSAAAADDLVQETFLQVHLSAGSFDPARAFKPWLYTIAANKGRDFMRARGRRPVQSLDSTGNSPDGPSPAALLETGDTSADEDVEVVEQRQLVRTLISRMPDSHRMILVLGYYQKLPYAEIAEILGVPVGTVKSRLHAAVSQFAKLWQAETKTSLPER